MKKITILLAAALFMMSQQTKGQNMALTTKQQALVAIAANEAKGDLEQLRASLNKGLDNGLTVTPLCLHRLSALAQRSRHIAAGNKGTCRSRTPN